MYPKIEQKTEGFKKIIFIKQKLTLWEMVMYPVFFSFFLSPFYMVYANDPTFFSRMKAEDLFFFLLVMSIIVISLIVQLRSCINITQDGATGSITLEKKSFRTRSYIFNQTENPSLRLSKMPFMSFLFSKPRYILSILSSGKRIIVNPDVILQGFATRERYRYGRNNAVWTFTEEEARSISNYLNIPLVLGVGDFKETKEYFNALP